jgi:hypothetical protein
VPYGALAIGNLHGRFVDHGLFAQSSDKFVRIGRHPKTKGLVRGRKNRADILISAENRNQVECRLRVRIRGLSHHAA